ncbi:MAG: DUF1343 domain-containing protein [Chlorobi bacterium]|nr:DUF1343 domain-containing protein [Chlorobiota bacterium]
MFFNNFLKTACISLFISLFLFSCSYRINHTIISDNYCSDTIKNVPEISISDTVKQNTPQKKISIETGDKQFNEYFPLIKNKRIAIVSNQTSMIDSVHLLDFLISQNINVVKIFALEHGFRGNIDRGKEYSGKTDKKTGVPIVAMYGKNRKPTAAQLENIDFVLFDIQDVGVRFYTYISSMYLMMEACAENHKKLIILDRPNPLGFYVDGPVLKSEYKSFVGMFPIPVVYGLTTGELALMINGEGWLKNHMKCDLTVVKIKNYKHSDFWHLAVKPSPNLPNYQSVLLYPSLCFFEATEVSIGRGTKFPFQVIGFPNKSFGEFSFIPEDIPGMQMNPVQEGIRCYGVDLRNTKDVKFSLKYLIDFYNKFPDKSKFITRKKWFNLLAGNSELYNQITSGMSEEAIRKTWQKDLDSYKNMRKKYLLYLDF